MYSKTPPKREDTIEAAGRRECSLSKQRMEIEAEMQYQSVLQYIDEIPKFTKKTTLAHTERLLDELGHPEEGMKILHVAGTNGKGSVCAYLNSMLQEGGYRVGLFTSPHLIRLNERFQINSRQAENAILVSAFERVQEAIRRTAEKGDEHPTYFETLLLMGLVIFQQAEVDYTILEVGMGGRLDATNVIKNPLISVITSISLDHTEYLGDTIAKIASEKAGIIKKHLPVVYDAHDPEAAEVMERTAKEKESPAVPVYPEQFKDIDVTPEGISFAYKAPEGGTYPLKISSVAQYQMMNAALAFQAMLLLQKEHGIRAELLQKGILRTKWPCRMESIMPGVVIDGAHNIDGIARFVETAQGFHKDGEITILFSAVNDKLYDEMIREIAEGIHPEHVVTALIAGPRGSDPEELAERFRALGCPDVTALSEPGPAFDVAYQKKGTGMLFCVGSLYLAGQVREWIHKKYHV